MQSPIRRFLDWRISRLEAIETRRQAELAARGATVYCEPRGGSLVLIDHGAEQTDDDAVLPNATSTFVRRTLQHPNTTPSDSTSDQ